MYISMVYKINLIQVAKQHRLAAEISNKGQTNHVREKPFTVYLQVTEGDVLLMILQLQI